MSLLKSEVESQDKVGKQDIYWYLYLHKNPSANETIARYLDTGAGGEDRVRRNVLCGDGKRHDLWYVSYDEALSAKQAGKEYHFLVTIFSQKRSGVPRKWIDPNIKRDKQRLKNSVKKGALR